MPKIVLIGAGSTVFAKNLIGDILAYPELAESTITLHDIDEQRLHTTRGGGGAPGEKSRRASHHRGAAGPPRPGRRRLRHLDVPGGGLSAVHRARFRDPEALRAAPDHRRYARHRRHHARTAHHPRLSRYRGRHGAAVPRCLAAELRQPYGDHHLGAGVRDEGEKRRAVPQRAEHGREAGPGHRHSAGRDSLRLRGHQPHGVLPAILAPHAGGSR